MQCRDCKWWDIKKAWGEKKDKASCKVLPPQILMNGMACNPTASWPTTYDSDWCGCHIPKSSDERTLPGPEQVKAWTK